MKNKIIALITILAIIIISIYFIQKPSEQLNPNLGIISNDAHGLNIGDTPPDFILETLDNNQIKLSDFKNKKAVLVNFWATWCPPCREEMPIFEDIYQKNSDNLEILGVNLQESEELMNKFLLDIPVSYPILKDPNKNVKNGYKIRTQPVSYFIDKQGVIQDIKFGLLVGPEYTEKFGKIDIKT